MAKLCRAPTTDPQVLCTRPLRSRLAMRSAVSRHWASAEGRAVAVENDGAKNAELLDQRIVQYGAPGAFRSPRPDRCRTGNLGRRIARSRGRPRKPRQYPPRPGQDGT